MGLGAMGQTHKDKLKKKINDDNFRRMQNPGNPQGHRSMTSHFNIIKKRGNKEYNQGNVDDQNRQMVSRTHTRINKAKTLLGIKMFVVV